MLSLLVMMLPALVLMPTTLVLTPALLVSISAALEPMPMPFAVMSTMFVLMPDVFTPIRTALALISSLRVEIDIAFVLTALLRLPASLLATEIAIVFDLIF
jgi:hypothetical protein